MNSIKAFLKAKGLYLVCLALVFAATITGIAAIRSVVRGVEDLTRIQKQALEEGTDVWDSPDAAVNQPAQDVPVATAQPSPAPPAAGAAPAAGIDPQGEGHTVLCQRLGIEQAVHHRHAVVRGGVPQEGRRGIFGHMGVAGEEFDFLHF